VAGGQVIGYSGPTGLSTGCQLHFEVYVNGTAANPMGWL
jgi:murein DD-endopeptidase MepM/ murein hydrolase activator NlpD